MEISDEQRSMTQQVDDIHEFLSAHYRPELMDAMNRGDTFIIVDFRDLAKYHIDIATQLLEEPDDILPLFRNALNQFDFEVDYKNFHFRFLNLPKSQKCVIRELRSDDLEKLLFLEGVVRQKSDVRPRAVSAKFECPKCSHEVELKQNDDKLQMPSRCNAPGCGYKGKFKVIETILVDCQGMVLEELSTDLEGGQQPKRLKVLLKEDLVSPITDSKTNPGTNVRIGGVLTKIEKKGKDGGKLTSYDYIFEGNAVESLSEDHSDIKISKKEEDEILQLAANPEIVKKLIEATAPGIYGHDIVKEAILMQFLGGVQKQRNDGVKNRGDMHVLLIGDPGSGKCVSGDTLITLHDGSIKPIKDLVSTHLTKEDSQALIAPQKLQSLQLNGVLAQSDAVRVWRRKTSQLLKIKTQSGRELTVTPNHPLFESANGNIIAKEAKDFIINQPIAIPSKSPVEPSVQFFTKPIVQSKKTNAKMHTYPQVLDTAVARLLGYLCGDGSVRYTPTSFQISFTNQDIESISDVQTLLKYVFGRKPTLRSKNGCSELTVHSINIAKFFEMYFAELIAKADKKTIPEKILRSQNITLAAFFKSLFECDAHVNTKKRHIEYCTISKDLAQKTQIALARFGIVALLKQKVKIATNTVKKRKITAYEIIIPREGVEAYQTHIGFVSQRKKKSLQTIVTDKTVQNTNICTIPNLGNVLKTIRIKHNLTQKDFDVARTTYMHWERNERDPATKTIRNVVSKLKTTYPTCELVAKLHSFVFSDVFWDKIVSIEPYSTSKPEYVYDFEVVDTHNFVANGIIAHNSQLLKRASVFAPKAKYVSGKGASGAGLTASVIKDEFMGGWALEAGALVLANKGVCLIDELDKMTTEDRSAMHEALEQQTVTIAKANIQATLRCETTVLAAANPKMGRFDPFEPLAKQINLPPALISRFDLIFPFRDIPDEEVDKKLADFILNMHQTSTNVEPEIDTDTLRKYIVYARKNCFPSITDAAKEDIVKFYVKMRNDNKSTDGMSAVPITPRQLEALVRMAESSAKMRLAAKATKRDAKRAIEILEYCLAQIGTDPDTGKIDIDRIATGVTTSQRSKVIGVREMIKELEEKYPDKMVPLEEILDLASRKGMQADKVEEALEKLKLNGDVYEPKRNFISRIV